MMVLAPHDGKHLVMVLAPHDGKHLMMVLAPNDGTSAADMTNASDKNVSPCVNEPNSITYPSP